MTSAASSPTQARARDAVLRARTLATRCWIVAVIAALSGLAAALEIVYAGSDAGIGRAVSLAIVALVVGVASVLGAVILGQLAVTLSVVTGQPADGRQIDHYA